jgi:hypothetical protein
MADSDLDAVVSVDGLSMDGHLFDRKLPLDAYCRCLGAPNRTIEAGLLAPFGHQNNHVHIYDSTGIYLTEHHASRLIDSVNFIFDRGESPFPIHRNFQGDLNVSGQRITADMTERELGAMTVNRDLPGEYSVHCGHCWIGISTKAGHRPSGKRARSRHIVRASVCFK